MTRDSSGAGDLLVIGYGNTLRRDDGAGPLVAEAVAAWNLPSVRAIACHQLTPELAEKIAQAKSVVFVDATVKASSDPSLMQMQPVASAEVLAHATDPASLLELARRVYGHCPPAWKLAIPAVDLGFGDGLSARAQQGVEVALVQIKRLVSSGKMQ